MWHISFMGNKKNQEFKNDVLPKNSKKITNNLITHNQQVNPINEIIFRHKCQEN